MGILQCVFPQHCSFLLFSSNKQGKPQGIPEGKGTSLRFSLLDMFLQVKINSRGLVYSVVLLLGSVALTVGSFSSVFFSSLFASEGKGWVV